MINEALINFTKMFVMIFLCKLFGFNIINMLFACKSINDKLQSLLWSIKSSLLIEKAIIIVVTLKNESLSNFIVFSNKQI
jgi:hypothetical protein